MDQESSNLELMENLEHILSTIRHEVGNSINSLKITLDVLRENFDLFDDAKKKDYLKRGSKLVARQQELVNAMEAYSRFNVKEQEEIQFLNFWESFLTAAATKLKDRNIKFVRDHDTEPFLIKANNMALNKIMMSILDNAIQAVEVVNDPQIELRVALNNDFVTILLKDNGCGIRKNDISKALIPLFTTKPGKMGMGLPIARKLLVKMGGRIEIKSPFEDGTEVRVWLRTAGGQEKEVGYHI
ncbi:MAG: HAMP domain-containing histidine kinase [Deltaproteobacteria bacterium]|nr:HAMP domain-containing histidine kinase [Deltaproteobacteria bacterium]